MTWSIAEIETPEELRDHLSRRGNLRDVVVQGVDLGDAGVDWEGADLRGAFFVGCDMPDARTALLLEASGAVLFPDLGERPFRVYPPHLYTYEQLVGEGLDAEVQRYFDASRSLRGGPEPDQPIEAIAQRLHDTAMTDAIWDLVVPDDGPPLRVAGIMGGHARRRDDPVFWQVVEVAFALARAGATIATGGGPGVMEAANLGAYLAGAGSRAAVAAARSELAAAPTVDHPEYAERAEAVHASIPGAGGISIAIPTWLYDHEPVGRFASHIAKYFANSIREDGLLRLARAGIVFAPGGAGTVQEVFQDLAVNSYAEPHRRAPMVFLGREFFTATGIFRAALAIAQASDPPFGEMLTLTDEPEAAVAALTREGARA